MTKIDKYLKEVQERLNAATPCWDARCRDQMSNLAKPRHIWSDLYQKAGVVNEITVINQRNKDG